MPVKQLRLIVLLLFAAGMTRAQNGLFTFYSLPEGLPQSTVTALYKDPRGYLWVGTGGGLSLFDGYGFRNIRSDYNDTSVFFNNMIRNLVPQAAAGKIWVGTEDGFIAFDRNGKPVSKAVREQGRPDYLRSLAWAGDTALWLFKGPDQIITWNAGTGKASGQFHVRHLQSSNIFNLSRPGDFVFADTLSALVFVSAGQKKMERYPLNIPVLGSEISGLVEIGENRYLLGTRSGFWIFDRNTGAVSRLRSADPQNDGTKFSVRSMALDNRGLLWFCADGDGLYAYDLRQDRFRPCFWQQDGTSVREKLKRIQHILCDATGVIWLGTDGSGLGKLNVRRLLFGEQFISPLVSDTCNWFIRSLHYDRDTVYAGTFRQGLKIVGISSGRITTVWTGGEGNVNAIAPGPGRQLCLATDNGLLLLDIRTHRLRRIATASGQSPGNAGCLLRLSDGRLLVSYMHQLYIVDNETTDPVLRLYAGGFPQLISALYETRDHRLLVALRYYGISVLSEEGKLVDSMSFRMKGGAGILFKIYGFAEAGGRIWASSNSGLFCFDEKLRPQKTFTVKDGLPTSTIYDAEVLSDSVLALSTGKGVSFFHLHTGRFRNFDSRDGMHSDECNSNASFCSGDYLFIGGINGFDRLRLPIKYPVAPPALIVPGDLHFGSLQMESDSVFSPAAAPELSYQQNSLSVSLWSTDFAFSERALYRFYLEDETGAVFARGDQRFVSFAGIPEGTYRLSAGVQLPGSDEPAVRQLFRFTIHPPFWKTGWFLACLLLLGTLVVTLVVYLFFFFRTRRKLRQLELSRRVEQVRIRISGDLHDDLGAGLTQIALCSDLLSDQYPDQPEVREKTIKLGKLARSLSQSMKEVVWSVKPEYDNLGSMIRYFREYCYDFFDSLPVAFSFTAGDYDPDRQISPEHRRALLLVMKEGINNIARHAEASTAGVEIRICDDRILMEIWDDGKGMSEVVAPENMRSNGLRNMFRRAKEAGLEMDLQTAAGKGVRLLVSARLDGITTKG